MDAFSSVIIINITIFEYDLVWLVSSIDFQLVNECEYSEQINVILCVFYVLELELKMTETATVLSTGFTIHPPLCSISMFINLFFIIYLKL